MSIIGLQFFSLNLFQEVVSYFVEMSLLIKNTGYYKTAIKTRYHEEH